MNQTRVLTILIQDLEQDQLCITNSLIHEKDDTVKKDMMKQLSCICNLIKSLTLYNLKYIDPPEVVPKASKPEKAQKQKTQYNIKVN